MFNSTINQVLNSGTASVGITNHPLIPSDDGGMMEGEKMKEDMMKEAKELLGNITQQMENRSEGYGRWWPNSGVSEVTKTPLTVEDLLDIDTGHWQLYLPDGGYLAAYIVEEVYYVAKQTHSADAKRLAEMLTNLTAQE